MANSMGNRLGRRVWGTVRRVARNSSVAGMVRELALPPVCLFCGRAGQPGLDCCAGCQADLPRPPGSCRRCAISLPGNTLLCGQCSRNPPAYDQAVAAFDYLPPLDGLIQRFKFSRDLAAGRVLARLMAAELAWRRTPRPDLVIPVPLHARRRFRRGYNQSALLARDLCRHFAGLPWVEALARTRPTAAQSDLPAEARQGNVRRAFACRNLPPGTGHAALLDDVMTTGSTVAECARELKRSGVRRVDVWVLARA